MNRKDTILVAVLINAGVLVVLFTSALKNKHAEKHTSVYTQPVMPEVVSLEPVAILKDEIDLAIEQAKKEQFDKQQELQAPQEIVFETQAPAIDIKDVAPTHLATQDYTVKKGDFLAKIAKRFNISVDELMKANQLKNSNLRVGQILKVPQTAPAPIVSAQIEAKQELKISEKFYVVKAGDNPWTIAHKHNMKVEELLKMNHMTAEKAKSLKIGDKLKVKS